MAKRRKYLDADGKRIQHGARYIYENGGFEAKGTVLWDYHHQCYMLNYTTVRYTNGTKWILERKQVVPLSFIAKDTEQAKHLRREPESE